jgi:hypothetical protein
MRRRHLDPGVPPMWHASRLWILIAVSGYLAAVALAAVVGICLAGLGRGEPEPSSGQRRALLYHCRQRPRSELRVLEALIFCTDFFCYTSIIAGQKNPLMTKRAASQPVRGAKHRVRRSPHPIKGGWRCIRADRPRSNLRLDAVRSDARRRALWGPISLSHPLYHGSSRLLRSGYLLRMAVAALRLGKAV